MFEGERRATTKRSGKRLRGRPQSHRHRRHARRRQERPLRRHGRARRRARPPQVADRLHRGARRRRLPPARSTSRSASSPAAARPPTRSPAASRSTRRPRNMPPRQGITLSVEPLNRFECYFLNTAGAGRRPGEARRRAELRLPLRHLPLQHRGELDHRRRSRRPSSRSTTSTSPRTIAAFPAPATSISPRCSRR